ncbi:MAG: cell division protein ZapA [Geminicoccaceae bacterium]
MATVEVQVLGRPHTINCDPGQEHRVRQLAHYVNGRVNEVSKANGSPPDLRMLVITSLLMADDLSEANDKIDALNGSVEERIQAAEDRAAEMLDHFAKQLEDIAARIESA